MPEKGELPREENVRLCAIEITEHDPLLVDAIASTGAKHGLTAAEYVARAAPHTKKAGA